jgi:hypothetical protein
LRSWQKSWRSLKNRFVLLLTIFCLSLSKGYLSAETKPIGKGGAQFPDNVFKDILSGEERLYLGLSRKAIFSFKDFTGTLFIAEVFNTYCVSCPKNVPILNDVYSTIQNDPKLRGIIKVVAIAAGNNINEVKSFRNEYHVLYPILSDPGFTAHKALGNPRVPYTVFIKKTTKGNIVIFTHQGVFDSADEVLRKMRNYLPK